MAQQATENISYWTDLVIGLLDKGEWKVLLSSLVITFAVTYILKLVYLGLFDKQNKHHIRLVAIIAGFIAAKLMWRDDAISMPWHTAGIMLGPLSILLHHLLNGYSKTAICKATTPWLYILISGKDRRSQKRAK